jgi:hypothetical protein
LLSPTADPVGPVRVPFPPQFERFPRKGQVVQASPFRLLVALAAISAVVLPGCHSDQAKLGSVTGKVTLDGKPIAKGSIIFESPGQRPAVGRISDGAIVEVTTYDTGDGAPIGHHLVAISATEDAASGSTADTANPGEIKKTSANYMSGKSLLPTHYNAPKTSGLTADIKMGENSVEFDLSSKPKG